MKGLVSYNQEARNNKKADAVRLALRQLTVAGLPPWVRRPHLWGGVASNVSRWAQRAAWRGGAHKRSACDLVVQTRRVRAVEQRGVTAEESSHIVRQVRSWHQLAHLQCNGKASAGAGARGR
jgi:hypothetical protein